MKSLSLLLLTCCALAQVPDTPQPQCRGWQFQTDPPMCVPSSQPQTKEETCPTTFRAIGGESGAGCSINDTADDGPDTTSTAHSVPTAKNHGATTSAATKSSADSFWQTRRWNEPDLASNKQVFKSKVFVISHLAAFGLAIAAKKHATVAANGGAIPGWGDTLGPPALLTGIDYVAYRWFWKPLSLIGATGEGIYQMKAIVTRKYQ
jgi:hypothetical protein